jgi:hypothetical protein
LRRSAVLVVVAALLVPGAGLAEPPAFHLDGVRLAVPPLRLDPETSPPEPTPPPRRRLLDKKSAWLTAGLVGLVPVISYTAWWRDTTTSRFSFAHENWFGEETYAGGADKASHVVVGYFGQSALQALYQEVGRTREEARKLSIGVGLGIGLLIELGDGFSEYGAAWEDVVSNAVGIAAGAFLDAHGLHDTIGMRFGFVKTLIPDPCCRYGGYGLDYSREIHTIDVKLAGLLPRLGVAKPGPGRFFLVSLAYTTKGYRYSGAPWRERDIGLEVGLNVPEILRALGVRNDTWWGRPLLLLTTYFRIPYTSFGWRYDMNHQRLSGPDTGDRFDPGSILYD